MELAQRLQRIPPYPFREIARTKSQMLAEGRQIIDFGIGDPDMPTPNFVIEALCEAAHDPATHQYDESGYGIPEFKQAISDFADARYEMDIDPDGEIQSCLGAKEALAHIVWAYIDPADVVLVPEPAYPVYGVQSIWCGATAFPMPLLPENDFLPDLAAIPPSVAQQAKLLFVNYPNNPTAAAATLEFFEELVGFARDNELLIVQDAAYNEVTFDGYQAPSILQVPGAKEVAIEFHSLSKTFNMTGWRVGWAWGGRDHIDALSTVKSNVDSGTFMAIQRAAVVALANFDSHVPQMHAEYQRRTEALVEGLNSLGWNLEKPQATFYVWAPVPPSFESSAQFAQALLEQCGVLVTPGSAYGATGEGFFRMSLTLGGPDKLGQIQQAIDNIARNMPELW